MADVKIRIIGDSTSANRALDETEGKASSFGKKVGSVLAAIGGAAAAKGIFDFAKSSIGAFKESEDSASRLQVAFQKFPALNDSNIGSFQKLNTELAKKTKFDDDATASGQAVLAQFGLTGQQITQLTPLLQDYAAKTGKDIPSAADALGKAMLGKGKALQEIGIKFKDTGSLAGNFDQTIGGLRSQVGGFAEVEGKTAAGRAEILHNQFGELQETVGSKLVPVLTTLSGWLLTVVNFFTDLSPGVQTAIGVAVGLAGAAFVVVQAVQAWTAVQAVLNVVMAMNPIGLVVIAIVALVAAIIYAYNHFDWFRNAVQAVFAGLSAAAQWVATVFSGVWSGIVSGFHWVADELKSIANWITRNVVNKVIDGINLLIRGYNILPGHSDLQLLPQIPQLAAGGIVTSPTLALIGESGPEAVVPLDRGMGGGVGGGTTVNINFNGVTTREAADQVIHILEQHFSRGGTIGNRRGGALAFTTT
jgi:hypothetical protein